MPTVETNVARIVAFQENGALCYAEMWNIICAFLVKEDIELMLNGFSGDLQLALISALRSSPSSINAAADPSGIRQAIVDWCQRQE